MIDEEVVYRLDVVVALPTDRDIDDLIFEIEGSSAAGTDVVISVSDVEKE